MWHQASHLITTLLGWLHSPLMSVSEFANKAESNPHSLIQKLSSVWGVCFQHRFVYVHSHYSLTCRAITHHVQCALHFDHGCFFLRCFFSGCFFMCCYCFGWCLAFLLALHRLSDVWISLHFVVCLWYGNKVLELACRQVTVLQKHCTERSDRARENSIWRLISQSFCILFTNCYWEYFLMSDFTYLPSHSLLLSHSLAFKIEIE